MNTKLINFARIARKYFSEDDEVLFNTVSKEPDGRTKITQWTKEAIEQPNAIYKLFNPKVKIDENGWTKYPKKPYIGSEYKNWRLKGLARRLLYKFLPWFVRSIWGNGIYSEWDISIPAPRCLNFLYTLDQFNVVPLEFLAHMPRESCMMAAAMMQPYLAQFIDAEGGHLEYSHPLEEDFKEEMDDSKFKHKDNADWLHYALNERWN